MLTTPLAVISSSSAAFRLVSCAAWVRVTTGTKPAASLPAAFCMTAAGTDDGVEPAAAADACEHPFQRLGAGGQARREHRLLPRLQIGGLLRHEPLDDPRGLQLPLDQMRGVFSPLQPAPAGRSTPLPAPSAPEPVRESAVPRRSVHERCPLHPDEAGGKRSGPCASGNRIHVVHPPQGDLLTRRLVPAIIFFTFYLARNQA